MGRLLRSVALDLRDLLGSVAGKRGGDGPEGPWPPGFKAMAAAGVLLVAAAGLQVQARGSAHPRTHLRTVQIAYAWRN